MERYRVNDGLKNKYRKLRSTAVTWDRVREEGGEDMKSSTGITLEI